MKNEYGVEMIPVVSSNVQAIGYDDANQYLYVSFLNNTLYRYHGVNIGEFEGLRIAPSVGSYLHRNIKGLYTYERLE